MTNSPFDQLTIDYVHLGLQLHNHDANPFIYLGNPEWRERARSKVMPLPELETSLRKLQEDGHQIAPADVPGGAMRHGAMMDRIAAMRMRVAILQGQMPNTFDEEVRTLYSVEVPQKTEAHFRALTSDLEQVVPGSGPLSERLVRFRDQFLVPPEHIKPAMTEALKEARKRTRAHIDLPEGEHITVQMDTEGHFSGFAEYTGNGHTVVHFSQSLPLHADRIVELSTHEAYPGHHVQGTLIEAELITNRGWMEWTMLPLFGAHTVLAEGTANYGVRLSFDRAERIDYDREVVLPLAGLSHVADQLEDFHRYVDLVEKLNFARNEVARGYLYGGWGRDFAIEWLMEFGLETKGTATQRLAFIEALRSYVVTYNHGLDWVTNHIEGNSPPPRDERWRRLREMLETPVLPLRHQEPV